MNPKEIGKKDWEIMESARNGNTIGRMISELERDLEAYRKADQIISDWKFIYTMADQTKKYQLLREMLHTMGFSAEEISKIIMK